STASTNGNIVPSYLAVPGIWCVTIRHSYTSVSPSGIVLVGAQELIITNRQIVTGIRRNFFNIITPMLSLIFSFKIFIILLCVKWICKNILLNLKLHVHEYHIHT